MFILAHRGLWQQPEEKNTRIALQRAFLSGLGVETDIRDLDGLLVVSHDMPRAGALSLDTVLSDYVYAGRPGTLALNIKSDGLTHSLQQLLDRHGVTDYFCFDMSIPDMLVYMQADVQVAVRFSEYEAEGPLSRLAGTLWLDAFTECVPDEDLLRHWLSRGQRICLVSPELHGRPVTDFWAWLAQLPVEVRNHSGMMLCTDLPAQAQEALL